jgi:hypothetical protein
MAESPDPLSNGNGRRRRHRHRKPKNALAVRHAEQIARLADGLKRKQAIELRLAGKSYHEIADELGIEYQSAINTVNRALTEAWKADEDKLNELRQLEVDRLDRLWGTWFPRATHSEQPNMAAATLCLKIAKRRAELIGLDREIKVGATLNISVGAEQLRQVVEAAQDPEAALALERVAAMFAHGEEALEAEWSDLDSGAGDGDDEAEDEGDPEDRPDHHSAG